MLTDHGPTSTTYLIPSACAFLLVLFLAPESFGQSKSPSAPLTDSLSDRPKVKVRTQVSEPTAHAIALLKRLEENVLIYRSLGDFEDSGKLARVSFEVFQSDLEEALAEVEPILNALPESRGK